MENDDLEAQGLVAHSYDSLFKIRKKLRQINDISIPVRSGIGTDQIGIFILLFVVQFVLYGLVVSPIMTLLGIDKTLLFLGIWVLIPPGLAAQQITKPLKYGKSIPGTINSWLRFHLDDRIHRRGLPVRTPLATPDMVVPHYEREWVGDATFAAIVPGEADWTDATTERRLAGNTVELGPWLDARMAANVAAEDAAARQRRTTNDEEIHYRRGTGATVVLLDDEGSAA